MCVRARRASAAMAEARDALTNGIVSLGTVAFNHAELAAAASATPAEEGTPAAASGDSVAALGQELFAKLALAQDMEARQVHSLLVEPLQALLDDPRGPAGAGPLACATPPAAARRAMPSPASSVPVPNRPPQGGPPPP